MDARNLRRPTNTFRFGVIFQSPFDKRASSEVGDATTPISYGVNAKIYPNGDSDAGYQDHQADSVHNVRAGAEQQRQP